MCQFFWEVLTREGVFISSHNIRHTLAHPLWKLKRRIQMNDKIIQIIPAPAWLRVQFDIDGGGKDIAPVLPLLRLWKIVN